MGDSEGRIRVVQAAAMAAAMERLECENAATRTALGGISESCERKASRRESVQSNICPILSCSILLCGLSHK